jgi:uncharacterized membrane protein HdeD (DUF308 family)
MPIVKINWGWIALRGVVAVLFGILALARPGLTVAAIVIVFGAYAMVDGLYLCISSIADRTEEPNWLVYLFGGLAGFAVGVLTLAMPGVTAVALLYLIAAWAIVRGTIEIIAAVRLRKLIEGEWVYIFAGALSLLFGLLLIARPAIGTVVLMAWLGAYALLFGVVLIVLAFKLRRIRPSLVEL